jgi:hypothetical protein
MYAEAEFIELFRPAIEAGDETLITRIGPHINAALLGKRCTRGTLAREVLDSFPDSRLAEYIAAMIDP